MSHALRTRSGSTSRLRLRVLSAAVLATLVRAPHAEESVQRFEPVLPFGGLTERNSNLPDRAYDLLADRATLLETGDAIVLDVADDGIPADGQSVARVKATLLDRAGNKITRPVKLTLETNLGSILTSNAIKQESPPKFLSDRDRREPGVQALTDDGVIEFTLIAPREAGDALLRVSSGDIKVVGKVSFLPDKRPLLVVGIVEGAVHYSDFKGERDSPARPNDGLEKELHVFARDHDPDDARNTTLGGRAAVFAKGTVKDDYLVTFSYDTDKPSRGPLFRDIQPDQFYPIYGDASIKGFDAQSSRNLYLRVDKDKSNLVVGDIATDVNPSEARSLGRYSRSLTGAREHYEKDRVALNLFAAYDHVKQVVDEQPGRGISGPYNFSTPDGIVNSEKVEILTRDRNQPSVILRIQPLLRFEDYEFEPFSGRLLFRKPVPSLDENLNPISIRVTYEVEQGGPKFWVGGVDGQLKLSNKLEIGGSYVKEDDPSRPYQLGSVNATYALGERTFLIGEAARSLGDNQVNAATPSSDNIDGNAYRVELRHDSDRLSARVFAGYTDKNFVNPSATLSRSRRELSAKASYVLTPQTQISAEVLRTEEQDVDAQRLGALVTLIHDFNDRLRVEAGLRYSKDEVDSASAPLPSSSVTCNTTSIYTTGLVPTSGVLACPFGNGPINGNDVLSARLRLTAKVWEKASVYVEGEQDVKSDQHALAIGGEYQFLDKGRIYARHEYSKGISGLYGLSNNRDSTRATVFGVDTAYMKDGQLFSEYRMRDAIAGRDAEAAMGLRNLWRISEGLSFSTNFERIHTIAGQSREATAVGLGMEYLRADAWRFSARLEGRHSDDEDQYLSTIAVASKLNKDWSLLAKNLYSVNDTDIAGGGKRTQDRAIIGLAYRDTDTNVWSALGRYEFKVDKDTTAATERDDQVHIVSVHGNYKPSAPLVLSGQVAGKWVTESIDGNFNAQLLAGRLLYDINSRWDVGFQAGILRGDGAKQYGYGVEVGYLAMKNLWASVGYNFAGYSDRDLIESDYSKKGVYFRLRFKFDEDLFPRKGGAAR